MRLKNKVAIVLGASASGGTDVVLWLAGPAFVTGLNLPVSGGNQLTRSPRPDEVFGVNHG
jgi:hypothetical protein